MSKRLSGLLLLSLWSSFATSPVTGVCSSGKYGLDCKYTCHCSTSNCNDVTGCSNTCVTGWSGPKCNKENVALHKPTSQSSYYVGWLKNSSLAVDGNLNVGWQANNCMFTGISDPSSWWQVDLGAEYFIHYVAVHFRSDQTYRRNGVKVYSSPSVNRTNNGHLCGTTTSTSPADTSMTCDDTARYITLYQDTYNHGDTALNFCEVQVFVCDEGTFGADCSKFCHCNNRPCNYVTGECTGGCKQNWTENSCSVCDSDHYAPLCDKSCSSRHCQEVGGKSLCNKNNGQCDYGCTSGWMGVDCTEECSVGKYGDHCQMFCVERKCSGTNSTCDKVQGKCVDGCLSGWELPDCIHECRNHTFGPSCKFKCNERHCKGDNSTCDVQDGVCLNGCQPGWKNTNCTEKCDGNYGPECSSSCSSRHCKADNAPCDHVTGSCDGPCDAGWQGDTCIKVCDDGTYGENCNKSCAERHCVNTEVCDRELGQCEGGCTEGWTGVLCLQVAEQITDSPAPIIGGVVGVVVVLLIVVIIVIVYLRRRKRQAKNDSKADVRHSSNHRKTKEINYNESDANVYVNVEVARENECENKAYVSDAEPDVIADVVPGDPDDPQTDEEEELQDPNTYYNDVEPAPPFNLPEQGFDVTQLGDVIMSVRRQPGGFEAEYLKLPSGFKHPYTDSQIPENRCKNRFAGYYPYNNNRVKLSVLPNLPHSDYINASYVDAYEKPNYFIASQAPNKVTLSDFWRMIWEQECGQIVMLTNLVEAGKHKCQPYWKDLGSLNVGYFDVVVKEITERADYTVRKLEVTQRKSKRVKTFDHYHFTSWPDHGVPNVLDLLEFFWLTRETPPSHPGPVLVHCSAGIGRTGTYIALHILTDEMNKTGRINILQMMTEIRNQRKNMVQTKSQYECIFTTMLEIVKYGKTTMCTSDYTQKYAEKKGSLTMGHKTIDELAEIIASTDSSDKSLPLKNKIWVAGKDDLFVVQAPSKLLNKGYLLVYTPQSTENLLWKLILENDSLTLVTLENENDGKFIPKPSQSTSYGNITVTSVSETSVTREITLRILSIKEQDSDEKKEIANISLRCWNNETDSSTVMSCLTTLTEQILDRQNSVKFHPVTVVFDESIKMEGVSLCIMNNIMSAVFLDKQVEIFNNVRRFQSVLPSVHLSVDDFTLFCDLPYTHLESAGIYANM